MEEYLATFSTRTTIFALLAAIIITGYRFHKTGYIRDIKDMLKRNGELLIEAYERFKKYGMKK